MKVIVDTCVWSQFLRRNRPFSDPVAGEVTRLVRADAVQLPRANPAGLLSGVKPSERFEQLKAYLRFYPNLPQDEEDDETAVAYYNQLRHEGLQGTGTDLFICAVAARRGLKIFTTDTDFASYAEHLPIKLHRPRRVLS